MVADIDAVVAAHPTIVQKVAIGKSYQGRTIWAVKISDNVAVDENEPEVLFDGLTHSDEHMGLEMTLQIMHWLADGYGHDTRITNIVNTREVWIILAVNPDGAEYDITGGRFHFWRKNRQPNAGHDGDRDRPQPQLRLSLGRRRADEHEPARDHLSRARPPSRRPRPATSATSSPAASSTAGSRSGRRSRSTRPAGS